MSGRINLHGPTGREQSMGGLRISLAGARRAPSSNGISAEEDSQLLTAAPLQRWAGGCRSRADSSRQNSQQ